MACRGDRDGKGSQGDVVNGAWGTAADPVDRHATFVAGAGCRRGRVDALGSGRTHHLGYESGNPAGPRVGKFAGNGSPPKTVSTVLGQAAKAVWPAVLTRIKDRSADDMHCGLQRPGDLPRGDQRTLWSRFAVQNVSHALLRNPICRASRKC